MYTSFVSSLFSCSLPVRFRRPSVLNFILFQNECQKLWSFHPSHIVQKIMFVQTALCAGSTVGVDCM
jgi:hypothetical protein